MSRETWDRETWLDVSVNLVPIGILVVFVALFLVVAPWGIDWTLATILQFGLVVLMIGLTWFLTRVTADRLAD
jgi:flagellar biosynthesis component FlhA